MKKSIFLALAIIAACFTLSASENSVSTCSDYDEMYISATSGSDDLLAAVPRKKASSRKSTTNKRAAAPKVENYPNLSSFEVIQKMENKLDTYEPVFDKAETLKYLNQGLKKCGLDELDTNEFTLGSGTIGKDRKVVVAIQVDNFETAPMFMFEVKNGVIEYGGMYWSVRERDEFEIRMHCEGCGWDVNNIACKYYFSDKKELPYLLGVWNKTTYEAPKSKQQTLPFIVRLFE